MSLSSLAQLPEQQVLKSDPAAVLLQTSSSLSVLRMESTHLPGPATHDMIPTLPTSGFTAPGSPLWAPCLFSESWHPLLLLLGLPFTSHPHWLLPPWCSPLPKVDTLTSPSFVFFVASPSIGNYLISPYLFCVPHLFAVSEHRNSTMSTTEAPALTSGLGMTESVLTEGPHQALTLQHCQSQTSRHLLT